MSQKNFLDKRGLTYFYDKINSSYLIKYQNMSTNKTDLAVIATKYDSTSTYSIGDYCIYQEKLYKCSVNIETAEAWNSQHWIEVTISDELENIYNLFEDVLLKPQVSGTQGQVLTADGQGGQSWEDSIASGIAASDANEDGNIVINNTINVELDERPTENSVNGVTSGGVYNALSDYVKNTDYATTSNGGVVKVNGYGLRIGASTSGDGLLWIYKAEDNNIKNGNHQYNPIVPYNQHMATFYGLAKAAGDTTQSASSNAVGNYTDNAKAAIKSMLGVQDSTQTIVVSGTTPTITALSNARYICGEVSTLSITPPVSGDMEVIFDSGSTATVLTVPNTVKFPAWFDATDLDANVTYDIIITDGVYGVVTSWA